MYEGTKFKLCSNTKTNEDHYLLSTDIKSVIVEQTEQNGLYFSGSSKKITSYSPDDFFKRGKVEKIGNIANPSLKLRLSLVLKDRQGHLVKTPMSDPIHVNWNK